jgi:DNA-binding CsgD family transcriptional regulator
MWRSPDLSDAALRSYLETLPEGLILVGAATIVWANPAACEIIGRERPAGAHLGGLGRLGTAVLEALAARGSTPRRLRLLDGHGGEIYLLAHPLDAGHVALFLHRGVVRHEDLEALLHERYGLSRHEARVAVLIAGGRSNAEVARRLGGREDAVAGTAARVYGKLGVEGRVALARLLDAVGLGLGPAACGR